MLSQFIFRRTEENITKTKFFFEKKANVKIATATTATKKTPQINKKKNKETKKTKE